MRDHDELPLLTTIRSDDLLDVTTAPTWHRVEPVETVVCSRTFAQDDPEALRSRGPVAVASALLMPRADAEEALCTLREIAARHLRGLTTGRALKGLPVPIQEAVKREAATGIEQVEEAEREARQALLTGDLDRLGHGGQR